MGESVFGNLSPIKHSLDDFRCETILIQEVAERFQYQGDNISVWTRSLWISLLGAQGRSQRSFWNSEAAASCICGIYFVNVGLLFEIWSLLVAALISLGTSLSVFA